MEKFLENQKYQVFTFCKENGIPCYTDFSKKDNTAWTEIQIDGRVVFQFEDITTVKHFLEVIRLFKIKWNNPNVDKIEGEDFWFAVGEKETFDMFLDKYEKVIMVDSSPYKIGKNTTIKLKDLEEIIKN